MELVAFIKLVSINGPLALGWVAWILQLRENKQLRAELHRFTDLTLGIMAQDRAALSLMPSKTP